MKKLFKKNEKAFAMLFTVLVVSLMLAIGLGISDLTFKQTILSSLARDSQSAFYQADAGVECGLYYTANGPEGNQFSPTLEAYSNNKNDTTATQTLSCGNARATMVVAQSYTGYFVYQEQPSSGNQNDPCFSITIDMVNTPNKTKVSSRGFSTCQSTPRQVERGLNVTF